MIAVGAASSVRAIAAQKRPPRTTIRPRLPNPTKYR
jgi:hypothetical protein